MIFAKNKKIIFILLLFIIAFCLSACGSLTASTITNEDGSIQEQVIIALNTDEVLAAGYNIEEVKNDIYLHALSEANAMVSDYNFRLHANLILIDSGNTNSLAGGMEVVKKDWQNNTFTIGVKFKDSQAYKFYYNIEDNSNVGYNYEHHFFYSKMYFEGYTMFTRHSDLYNRLYSYYSFVYPQLIQDENNQLLYTHVADLRREHSNADYVTSQNGKYYHTWILNQSDLNQKITIYYNIANRTNIILLSIAIVLGITLILFLISFIINKINKNKKLVNKLIKKQKNQQKFMV